MFTVVKSVIRNKTKYPSIPLETIFAFNSFHKIINLKSKAGVIKRIESIGNRYPIFWSTFETTIQGNKLERIYHMNFIEALPNLENEWNRWESSTVDCYKNFYNIKDKDEILFGTIPNKSHIIKVYFKGKKQNLPFLY